VPLGARRPGLILAGTAVVLVALSLLGLGVEGKLVPNTLVVPGTESARGEHLLRETFGNSAPFAVLLQGPEHAVNRQGERLVAALDAQRATTTLSPWDHGVGLEGLRPEPGAVLILTDLHLPVADAIGEGVARIERTVAKNVSRPVTAHTAGFASIAKAIQDESVTITRRGELIVAPILLLILLLVFRSPVAAAIPLAFGATTVIAARGLISLAAGFVEISDFALSVGTMIGIALGVDYALLIVSRFREEIAAGAGPAEAAARTRATAGRTTVFAGATLLFSILAAALLVPGQLLFSLCATIVAVIVLAVAGPWLIAPAVLVLAAPWIDRWRIGRPGAPRSRWAALGVIALRQPWITVGLSGLLILLIALPATRLATEPVTVDELPSDNPARENVEAIEAKAQGGWISPLTVIAVSGRGPVTQPARLAAIDRWQHKVAQDSDVEAVVGLAPTVQRLQPIQTRARSVLQPPPPDPSNASGPWQMIASLEKATAAVTQLRHGLGLAGEGSHLLALGSGRARQGAELLANGLSQAASRGRSGHPALRRFSHGAHLVSEGLESALLATALIRFGAGELRSQLVGSSAASARLLATLEAASTSLTGAEAAAGKTTSRLEAAWGALRAMTVGGSDPQYRALEADLREALIASTGTDPADGTEAASDPDLLAELTEASSQLRRGEDAARRLHEHLLALKEEADSLLSLTARLNRGLLHLNRGGRTLAHGSDLISGAAMRISNGLDRLAGGATRLAGGLAQLEEGNTTLAQKLSGAFHRMYPLTRSTRRTEVRVLSDRAKLAHRSPRLFDSGYFLLSALDGAPARKRARASQLVDLERSGNATRILVVSDGSPRSPASIALYDRLRVSGARLARRAGLEVAVTGSIAETTDYNRANSGQIPLLVAVIAFATALVMIVVLRALPLALLAVLLNLATVAAAFGVLALLGSIPDGLPFSGRGSIDPVGAAGIFGVVFGISIDYAVFLLSRMRESWERDHDHETAISYGLVRTAGVITGAATSMIVVFGVFATTPLDTVSQFGIGLTVAVALDATVVRLMLLPALMKLLGPRVWWLPRFLERRLPHLHPH
jgi:RND superfamily putative drug exporter